MSITKQLTHHATFIQKVTENIIAKVKDRQAKAYTKDGLIEGTVTAYELRAEPVFGTANGDRLEWSIPFKVNGEATVGYKTGDGEYGNDTPGGPCEGFVTVTFPYGTLLDKDFDGIVSSVKISVTIESIVLDAKEPSAEPDLE